MWCDMNHDLIVFLRFENVGYLQNPTCNKHMKVACKKTFHCGSEILVSLLICTSQQLWMSSLPTWWGVFYKYSYSWQSKSYLVIQRRKGSLRIAEGQKNNYFYISSLLILLVRIRDIPCWLISSQPCILNYPTAPALAQPCCWLM